MSRTDPSWSIANRIGFVLVLLYAVANLIPSNGIPGADPGSDPAQAGPPDPILIADAVIAVAVIALVVIAWVRRSRLLARLAIAGTVLMVLSAFPAFFVPVPVELKLLVAVASVVAIAGSVLVLLPRRKAVVAA